MLTRLPLRESAYWWKEKGNWQFTGQVFKTLFYLCHLLLNTALGISITINHTVQATKRDLERPRGLPKVTEPKGLRQVTNPVLWNPRLCPRLEGPPTFLPSRSRHFVPSTWKWWFPDGFRHTFFQSIILQDNKKPYKKGCWKISKGLRVINCGSTWTQALGKMPYKGMSVTFTVSRALTRPHFFDAPAVLCGGQGRCLPATSQAGWWLLLLIEKST